MGKAAKLLFPMLLLAAGCGGVGLRTGSGAGEILIQAQKSAVDTNTVNQFSAKLASGAPTAVNWSIAGGENDASIGQGTIDSNGLYTPPPFLSRDAVNVTIRAVTRDRQDASTYSLTVTPGFVQPLTPENASLSPGGNVRLSGEIAEINSGSVRWFLAKTASGEGPLGAQYGSIGDARCSRSGQDYTYCTASYTAPAAVPIHNASFYAIAAAGNNPRAVAAVHILLNSEKFNSSALENQKEQQAGDVILGASGGNANDYDSSQDSRGNGFVNDCCGGTLGALVQDRNSNLYILSNNHVLAESDQARLGDTIVQPGLIDLDCNPQGGRVVGSLRYFVPLESSQTNVDAALAAATPSVDPSGAILQLGSPANGSLGAGAPAAGSGETLNASQLSRVRVVKSGRTTGLTCSTIGAINLNVQVDYYYDCAQTRPFYTKLYTDQLGIPGVSFADSGDSGALVLDASNAEAIGLLFASGADDDNHGLSIANPIQDVLSELSQESQAGGQSFQIVGGPPHAITCTQYDQASSRNWRLTSAQAAAAKTAADAAAAALMRSDNGILGVSTARSLDAPNEAAVVVYVDKNRANVAVPKIIEGLRTVVISTDEAGANAGIAPGEVPVVTGIHLPADVLRAAALVKRQYAARLMSDPAFFGVGVTQSYDNPAEAALLVLVDMKKTPDSMPDAVGGLRVRYLKMNRLHVTLSKSAGRARPTSCQLRAMRK